VGQIERMRLLQDLAKPDPRHLGRSDLLASRYTELEGIHVDESVPDNVRQLFETAKNLSLYSWYVYRFHPVARLVAYTCLESALRQLVLRDASFPKNKLRNGRPVFKEMLKHAVEHGWLRNEGFEIARHLAGVRAKQLVTIGQIEEMTALGLERIESREPSAEEIAAELESSTYVHGLTESIPLIRNHLAHGGSFLDSGSVAILKIVAEALNQLYPIHKRSSV
jgi:hypothetical protein